VENCIDSEKPYFGPMKAQAQGGSREGFGPTAFAARLHASYLAIMARQAAAKAEEELRLKDSGERRLSAGATV
jgi:hypothetical protein